MATESNFEVSVLTPRGELVSGEATEVVLPAHDGERGVLFGHQDFIGVLGTGAMKIVQEGNAHWFVVSEGVYRVEGGKLTILPQVAQNPDEINIDEARSKVSELEPRVITTSAFSEEFAPLIGELKLNKVRDEVFKKSRELN